jgi:UDP-N-acetylglucosamine--N-acetylmuramyl-(pentapeptide) pyrophosphoryl-undecaprenol N-acetylglucosamine transferase
MAVPVLLLEQNTIPGLTNRLVARVADRVVTSFPDSAEYFPRAKVSCLGNPLRRALLVEAAERHERSTGRGLLVLGGSQGARAINELMIRSAPRLREALPDLTVLHQTGAADHERVVRAYRELGQGFGAVPFIDEMARAYGAADLVLSRAGATTIAELTLMGKPAILIPYPHAADDHQTVNAKYLVDRGAALAVCQGSAGEANTAGQIVELLSDPERLRQMGQAMARCARPHAARDVVDLLYALALSR